MEDRRPKVPEQGRLKFVSSSGSVIGGMAKDKAGRVTEAMQDIKLSIDGLRTQLADGAEGERWIEAVAAFARACSLFLRKTVLGDFGRRETRLLDDRLLDEIGLLFHRFRKIPHDTRRPIQIGFGINRAMMAVTKLDDETLEPEQTYVARAGRQSLELAIEWPLPGVADWLRAPDDECPWLLAPDQLFRTDREPVMSCDAWLDQQVVLFNRRGISLREIFQTVVNFEGGHSINTSRLLTFEGEQPSRVAAKPAPHILNAITLFGIRYAHLLVIEGAMYLYDLLLDQNSIACPKGDIYSAKLGVECTRNQAESPKPDWIRFQGTMALSFSDGPTVIRHEIRAVR